MLTAIVVLICLVLLLAGKVITLESEVESVRKLLQCRECHGSGRDADDDDPEARCSLCGGDGSVMGETNRWTAQAVGRLDSIHDLIDKLWACPTCSGSGSEYCEACKGTGRRA